MSTNAALIPLIWLAWGSDCWGKREGCHQVSLLYRLVGGRCVVDTGHIVNFPHLIEITDVVVVCVCVCVYVCM